MIAVHGTSTTSSTSTMSTKWPMKSAEANTATTQQADSTTSDSTARLLAVGIQR
ncbi:hypothetical protein D9M71_738110 [compost metagenome]